MGLAQCLAPEESLRMFITSPCSSLLSVLLLLLVSLGSEICLGKASDFLHPRESVNVQAETAWIL